MQILPIELLYKIFEYTESKQNLITVFPCISNLIPKCSVCKKITSDYHLIFEYDSCPYCNFCHKKDILYMCSLKCKNLYHVFYFYDIKPTKFNNYRLLAYLDTKIECDKCGRHTFTSVKATGAKLTHRQSYKNKKIQELIALYLEKDDSSFIPLRELVSLYKSHFKINNGKQITNNIRYSFKQMFDIPLECNQLFGYKLVRTRAPAYWRIAYFDTNSKK